MQVDEYVTKTSSARTKNIYVSMTVTKVNYYHSNVNDNVVLN